MEAPDDYGTSKYSWRLRFTLNARKHSLTRTGAYVSDVSELMAATFADDLFICVTFAYRAIIIWIVSTSFEQSW